MSSTKDESNKREQRDFLGTKEGNFVLFDKRNPLPQKERLRRQRLKDKRVR
jgi:hypothetical protein